ncbi:MAG: inorganic pyrophosphatase [Candidatus Cloacimonetes bacterium]|nr:inorganic pyrophosphatase [Candidatus Cloacimonadota bacterium]
MDKANIKLILEEASRMFKPHPWHGIDVWDDQENNILNVYIEIVPDDTVKYELDKKTGYLRVDRPQKFSNIIPALYGFVPKTYSGDLSAKHTNEVTNRTDLVGDQDPLDICILTEKHIKHGDLLLGAIPIGGFRMIDHGEVDDKIIAVLKNDAVYGNIKDVINCPESILARLKHYFLTYKQIPGTNEKAKCEITHLYGREEAMNIINLSMMDYNNKFGL